MDQAPDHAQQAIANLLQRVQQLEMQRARALARKPPASSMSEPKLSSLSDPKAFGAWRRYWRRQAAMLEDGPEAHLVAAEWACSHTAGEVARLLQEQQFARLDQVTAAIRQAARARFGTAITPEVALLNIKISMEETPRQLADRAMDYSNLYGIDPAITLQAIKNATAHIALVAALASPAETIAGWLDLLAGAVYAADKPFNLIIGAVPPPAVPEPTAAAVRASTGPEPRGARGSGGPPSRSSGTRAAPRFSGACYSCGKSGHKASDCYSSSSNNRGGAAHGPRTRGSRRQVAAVTAAPEDDSLDHQRGRSNPVEGANSI